jgi:hypothetical protein
MITMQGLKIHYRFTDVDAELLKAFRPLAVGRFIYRSKL